MRNSIAERLLEERLRLKMNKSVMAQAGGVVSSAYANYEDGKRSPDGDFLSSIAAKGADVQYIVTGQRSLNPPSDLSAFDYQQNLLSNISRKVAALKLSDKYLAANLQNILFFAELGKSDDVIEAMQDYAGSNLTVAEKDLLDAYRKAAQPDKAFMDRLAQLTASAVKDEAESESDKDLEGK